MTKQKLAIFLLLAVLGSQALLGATDPGASADPNGVSDSAHKAKLLRAIAEEATLLTISILNYWSHYDGFIADTEFGLSLKDQLRRYNPKYWDMDANSFYTNWGHNISGGIYFDILRTNDLSAGASTLSDLCAHVVWKIVGEYKEDLFGIGDIINGVFGGTAVGECSYQIGSYFSYRQGVLNRLAEFLFNPFLVINNWLDHKQGPEHDSAPDAPWHRFSLAFGYKYGEVTPAGTTTVAQSGTPYNQFNVALNMEINSVPGYGQAETFQRFFSNTLSTRLFVDISTSAAGVEEYRIFPSVVLFGYAWQSLKEGPGGTVSGTSVSLGYGCGFDLTHKRTVTWYDSSDGETPEGVTQEHWDRLYRPTPVQFTDKMSVVNLGGPVLQVSWFGPRLFVHWTTEVYGDFGMIDALAYNRYTQFYDNTGVKTVLLDWGYYYAFGMTYGSDVEAEWGQWRLAGGVRYQWYDSIKGLDRYQYLGVVTNDFGIRDSRLILRLRLGYRVPRTPVELAVAGEATGRWGRILDHDVRDHYQENRLYCQVRLFF
jgi:hypothetical protein